MAKNTKILLETTYPRGYPAGGKVRVETSVESKPRIGGPRYEVIKYAADGTSHAWQLWTLREAAKHMLERAQAGDPGGSLLVTSSTSAIDGAPANEAYAASKTAVLGLIRGLAVEYARHGIRANALLPGWIRSDMTAELQGWDKFNDKVIGRVPMRRWGEPEDFAGIAVYLASDASRFHTGDSLVIDGGYTIF